MHGFVVLCESLSALAHGLSMALYGLSVLLYRHSFVLDCVAMILDGLAVLLDGIARLLDAIAGLLDVLSVLNKGIECGCTRSFCSTRRGEVLWLKLYLWHSTAYFCCGTGLSMLAYGLARGLDGLSVLSKGVSLFI